MRASLFAATASVVLAAMTQACEPCEEPDRPCIEWVELGETYQVELVQHFDPNSYPPGFGATPTGFRSCGADLDVWTGDTVALTAAERRVLHRSGCPICYSVRAMTNFAAIEEADLLEFWLGQSEFFSQGIAEVREDCVGRYTLGVARVTDESQASGRSATDYVFFRGFDGVQQPACLVDETAVAAGHSGCWDAWAVRIRDSGRLITRDLGPAPDAGR